MEELLTMDDMLMEFNTCYFPPAKRRRIMLQLMDAGKLNNRKLSPLESTQEKFAQEAHILNKTVIVDDDSERKVYSTCVFEGVKRYNCNVCITAVYGKTALIRHNCSKRHYQMLQRKTHPHQNFEDNKIIDLDPGMKTISTSDCYIQAEFLEQCKQRNIPHVLIGLEYLVEVLDPRDPYYHCLLCNKASNDMFNTMDHLQSIEHKMFYLLLYFPKVYKKLILLNRYNRLIQLDIVVTKIEKKYGLLRPWRHEGALSLKQKRAIRHSIDSGPHIRDDADLSFAEDIAFNNVMKNDKITDTVITEFVVDESEENLLEIYERQKGGIFRCRLCRVIVNSSFERIIHPYTGKHIEKTVKGIAIYDSVSCQIQGVLDRFPQPLIGTEYVVEYDEQGVYLYHCMLCRKAMNNHDMVTSHLVSKAHRQRYIKHHMPKKDEELLKLSGPVRAEEIEKLLKLIESHHRRLRPFGCLFSLEHQVDSQRTVKDLISEKIMDGRHFTIDDWGRPIIIMKMPVPLFPREGNVVPESVKQAKKKKKKSRDRSSSPSPKRRRSESPQSLSPVARQRGLSPEPIPSTSYLPQEVIPPPAAIQDWLSDVETDSSVAVIATIGSCQLTVEKIREFFEECDEENWETRKHDCLPFLSVSCPFKESLANEDLFVDLREYLTRLYLKQQGWDIKDLDISNSRFKNIAKIMETAQFCTNTCRPLCSNVVGALTLNVLDDEDFPETEEMSEEDIMVATRGLAHIGNWLYLLWSSLPEEKK